VGFPSLVPGHSFPPRVGLLALVEGVGFDEALHPPEKQSIQREGGESGKEGESEGPTEEILMPFSFGFSFIFTDAEHTACCILDPPNKFCLYIYDIIQ